MSKSKGNVVDPFEALATYGADATRWYFYVNSAPWLPNRYQSRAVVEGQRRFMGTLWNTYAFFVLYANIDAFDASKYSLDFDSLTAMDKWLLSKLNSLIAEVDDHLDKIRVTEAARALENFVDELSNWYVRRSRERFWAKGMEQDKINAYMTLYTTLVALSKCTAPMIPFMADDIYINLVLSLDKNAPESVHLCDFPVADHNMVDKELEHAMDQVLDIVVKGRACRNTANIKNRQPLQKMFVKAPAKLQDFYIDIIKEELNIKEVIFTDDVSEFTTYAFKPQLKTVGPKYGKHLGEIQKLLATLDGNQAMNALKTTGHINLATPGLPPTNDPGLPPTNDPNVGRGLAPAAPEIILTEADLLIEITQKEGYITEADNKTTVVIHTQLTDALIEEGFVYEIISKIQTMRKEAGFEVTDRIRLQISNNERLTRIIERNRSAIATKVLADVLGTELLTATASTREWNVNGETVTISIERVI
jgi:isoleucyl-tRNA synthetase